MAMTAKEKEMFRNELFAEFIELQELGKLVEVQDWLASIIEEGDGPSDMAVSRIRNFANNLLKLVKDL